MRTSLLTILSIALLLFLTECSSYQPQRVDSGPVSLAEGRWARDGLDLQRVGGLLKRSRNPREFETYLNQEDGLNNFDLNGDGNVDYISVEEYYDRDSHARGLSLYDCFGPDEIQEVATIEFYRDDPSWRGARVLVTGDDNIYGDNVYYESNWYDEPVDLVSFVYSPHDTYRSPYYYDNYPSDYVVYDVVDTPVYRARVQRFEPQPVLVFTQQPDFVSRIDIRSPNRDRTIDQIYARPAKPTREQQTFLAQNNPRPDRARGERPARIGATIETPLTSRRGRDNNFSRGPERDLNGDQFRGRGKGKGRDEGQPRFREPNQVAAQPEVQFKQPKHNRRGDIARTEVPRANNPGRGNGNPIPPFARPGKKNENPAAGRGEKHNGPPAWARGNGNGNGKGKGNGNGNGKGGGHDNGHGNGKGGGKKKG